MRTIYNKNLNVLEAGYQRVEYLFREFDEVIVGFSGGKDSTVVLNIAKEVARKLNRLPLTVLFLDQEAEWSNVIDYVREVMYDPEIKPLWLQMPFKITNSTSGKNDYLYAWEPGVEHIRPQDPISIKENVFGTQGSSHIREFYDIFPAVLNYYYPGKKACYLAGLRAQESPTRKFAVCLKPKYKWITWGKQLNPPYHYTFYPIYDWEIADVWKVIHDKGWKYCKLYDLYYNYGIPITKMRVSNVHHETAIASLYYLQEIEPQTWNHITARLQGINTAKHLRTDGFKCPEVLPFMFSTWKEYAVYLTENLIEPAKQKYFIRGIAKAEQFFGGSELMERAYKKVIESILAYDTGMVIYRQFFLSPTARRHYDKIRGIRGATSILELRKAKNKAV